MAANSGFLSGSLISISILWLIRYLAISICPFAAALSKALAEKVPPCALTSIPARIKYWTISK